MATTFKIDLKELEALQTNFKFRTKKLFHAVIRNVLDNQAFATMKMARKRVLPNRFNIRNAWVQSSVLVDKAQRNRKPIFMFSLVGGAKKWNRNRGKSFMGLREQQFGTDKNNPDIPTTSGSRGGSFKKKVFPSVRYNRLGKIENPDKYPGSSPENRVTTMLRILERQKSKKAFFIRRSSRIRTGVYKFTSGKVRVGGGKKAKRIKIIKDLSKSVARLSRRPWLTESVKKAVTKGTTLRFFKKNASRVAFWKK